MSEDECISILLNHCTECDLREYSSCNECENKFKKAIKGLLDLYQQEKENRRMAEHNYDELTKTTGRLETELEEEKEKNNKIEKYVRSNEWAEDYEKSSCRTKILRILEEE